MILPVKRSKPSPSGGDIGKSRMKVAMMSSPCWRSFWLRARARIAVGFLQEFVGDLDIAGAEAHRGAFGVRAVAEFAGMGIQQIGNAGAAIDGAHLAGQHIDGHAPHIIQIGVIHRRLQMSPTPSARHCGWSAGMSRSDRSGKRHHSPASFLPGSDCSAGARPASHSAWTAARDRPARSNCAGAAPGDVPGGCGWSRCGPDSGNRSRCRASNSQTRRRRHPDAHQARRN